MHFDFFIQRAADNISVGDDIAVFADADDVVQSGRFKVASLQGDDEGGILATLVGMEPLEGTVQLLNLSSTDGAAP